MSSIYFRFSLSLFTVPSMEVVSLLSPSAEGHGFFISSLRGFYLPSAARDAVFFLGCFIYFQFDLLAYSFFSSLL